MPPSAAQNYSNLPLPSKKPLTEVLWLTALANIKMFYAFTVERFKF